MDSILEQLYKGELYPYSTFQPTVDGLKENMDKTFDSYFDFLTKLPEDLKDEFIQFVDRHLGLLMKMPNAKKATASLITPAVAFL